MTKSASVSGRPLRDKRRRRRWAIAWALLVLTVAGAAVGGRWLQHRGERAEAIRLALEGRIAAAEPGLAAALERDPEDVAVLRARALGRLAAGQAAEAEEPLTRWGALGADALELRLAQVSLNVRLGRIPEAIEAARAALELQPGTDELREQLAHWLYMVGRTEEAATECRRCREARPGDASLALLEAEIAFRLGDIRRAESLAEAVLRDHARYAPALVLRGGLYLESGQPEQAVPLLRQALALGGDRTPRGLHYLSLALARTGQEAEARRVLAEAQRQQEVRLWEKYGRPESIGYKVSLAEALLATGRAQEAVELLERALVQDPGCIAAHRLLARHYDRQGQPARAAEHRRKAGE